MIYINNNNNNINIRLTGAITYNKMNKNALQTRYLI
jgi:hypothetical protein